MKKIFILFAVVGMAFSSCTGPEGPPGMPGQDGYDGLISEVFELKNINFGGNATVGYTIYQKLSPKLYPGDVILIYRLSDVLSSGAPVWQSIPRTLYPSQGQELDYDFDFSQEDFTIYAGGNYNLALTPQYLNNQTFRIVIVPGDLSASVSKKSYNEVMSTLNLKESEVKKIQF